MVTRVLGLPVPTRVSSSAVSPQGARPAQPQRPTDQFQPALPLGPPPVVLADIEAAQQRIHGAVHETPIVASDALSAELHADVHLKLENFQVTNSFKARGAANRLLALTEEEKSHGVIAASAGNHAQGLAYHGGKLGVPVTIVMPRAAPQVKVDRTRKMGAEVHLVGDSFDEALAEAQRLGREGGQIFVSAFDDKHVIAGQGTIGLEIMKAHPDVHTVVVPVGGGGLISGIATAVKAINPAVQIVGVQTDVLPSMRTALEQGAPTLIPAAKTLADGIAVRKVGAQCLDLTRRNVDQLVTVSEREIGDTVVELMQNDRIVSEGAGAVAVAALRTHKIEVPEGAKVIAVVSGGNIDLSVVSRLIAERAVTVSA
jgi:threonine dehydratase